jgi:hypothetical protein
MVMPERNRSKVGAAPHRTVRSDNGPVSRSVQHPRRRKGVKCLPETTPLTALALSAHRIYSIYMIAKIFKTGNSLALRLPKELGATEGEVVEIDAQGDRWVVRPAKPNAWPRGFFSRIRLSDPSPLKRPSQGAHRKVDL